MSELEKVLEMPALISLDYLQRPTPLAIRFTEELAKKRILGHKCPVCGTVYSPPRGFCPLDVVETSREHEVEVSDKGTVTSFTIVEPVQYYGQKEQEAYVQANILLDGSDTAVGQQRIPDVPFDQIRTGMRVQAVWRNKAGRDEAVAGGRGLASIGAFVKHFEPLDEPDAVPESYRKHVF